MASSNGGPSKEKAWPDQITDSVGEHDTADEQAESMNNFAAIVNKLATSKLSDPKQHPSSLNISVPDPGEISLDAMMAVHQAALGRPHPIRGVEPEKIAETYRNTARYPGVQSNILRGVTAQLHENDRQELQGQALGVAEAHLRNTFFPLLAGVDVPPERIKTMFEETYNSSYNPPARPELSAAEVHHINLIRSAAQRMPVAPAPIRGPGALFTPDMMTHNRLAEQSRDAPVLTSRVRAATISPIPADAIASPGQVPTSTGSQAGPSYRADAPEHSTPPQADPTPTSTQVLPTVPTMPLVAASTIAVPAPSLDPRRRPIPVETVSSPALPARQTGSPEPAPAASAPILSVGSPQPRASSPLLETPRSPPSPTLSVDLAEQAAVYAQLMSSRAPTAQMFAPAHSLSEGSPQSHASSSVSEIPEYLQSPTYSIDSADEAAVNALSMSPPQAPTTQILAPPSTVSQTNFLRLTPATSAPVVPTSSSQPGPSAAPVSTRVPVQRNILPCGSSAAPTSTASSPALPQVSQHEIPVTTMAETTSSAGMNAPLGHEQLQNLPFGQRGGLELDNPTQTAPSGSLSPFLIIPASPASDSIEPSRLTAGALGVSLERPTDGLRAVRPDTPAPSLASFTGNVEPPRQRASTSAPIASSLRLQGAPPLNAPHVSQVAARFVVRAAPPLGPPGFPLAASLLANGPAPSAATTHAPRRVISLANITHSPVSSIPQVPRPSATAYPLPPRATLALPGPNPVHHRPCQAPASSLVARNARDNPTSASVEGWFNFPEESLTPQAYRAVKRPSREPIKLIKLKFKKNKHYLLGSAAKDLSQDPMLQIRATRIDAGIAQARNTRLGMVPEIFALQKPIWNIYGSASSGSAALGGTAYGSASGGSVAMGGTTLGSASGGPLALGGTAHGSASGEIVPRGGPAHRGAPPGVPQSASVQLGSVQPGRVQTASSPDGNPSNSAVQDDGTNGDIVMGGI